MPIDLELPASFDIVYHPPFIGWKFYFNHAWYGDRLDIGPLESEEIALEKHGERLRKQALRTLRDLMEEHDVSS